MRRPIFEHDLFSKTSRVTGALRRMMTRTVSVLAMSSFVLTSVAGGVVPARADSVRRVALVVGNSKYVDDVTALSNPVNDANDVADALQGMGFDVTRALDVNTDDFRKSLRLFAQKAHGAGVAVFYYAGHAMHFDDESYLMPIGVKLEDESAVRFDMISVEDDVIGKTLRDVPLKVLLLDACRDNPIAEHYETDVKTRSLGKVRGLSPLPDHPPAGQLIAYATQPNQVAADGDGRNSPFSAALKKHIAEPGVEIRAMLDEVKADVARETQAHQQPDIHENLTEKVFLNPGESDRDVWARIEKSDDAAVFNDFLTRYPKSDFVSAARANIRTLELEATVKRLEAEQAQKAEAAAKEAAVAQEIARKQTEAAQDAARARQAAEAEAARQKSAREAAEAQIAAEAARQKELEKQEAAQAEAARQEAQRLEQASKEAARLEAERQQAARAQAEQQAAAHREQLREQALLDAAAREKAAKEEAARQEAARVAAAQAEAAQKQAAKMAEEAQKDAARQAEASAAEASRQKALAAQQEAERQAALRVELARQEAERQRMVQAQHEWQDAQRDEARRFQAEQDEAARKIAQQQEDARQQAAREAADKIAAARAEANRRQAEQQQAAKAQLDQQNAAKQVDQAKLAAVKQKEAEASRAREDAARNEKRLAEAKLQAEKRAIEKANVARQAVVQADETRRRRQMVSLERKTANIYAVARPARAESPMRPSAPAAASEAPGCMTCGF